jgi:hypothetical protein
MVIIIVFIPLSTNSSPLRDPVGPIAPADISIVPDQEVYTLTTEPGVSDDTVFIHGHVSCKIPDAAPPQTTCIVQIYVEQGGSTITVPRMEFTKDVQILEFSVHFTISPNLPAGAEYALYYWGNWYYEGGLGSGEVGSVTGSIKITQFGSLELMNSYGGSYWSFYVDEWRDYTITLKNNGNGVDNITLAVVEKPEGVKVELELDELKLKSGGEREVHVKVKQEGGRGKTGVIRIKCASSFSGTNSFDTVDVNIKTTERSGGPAFEVIMTVGAVSFIIMVFVLVVIFYLKYKKKHPRSPI